MIYTAALSNPPPLEGRWAVQVIFDAGDISAFKPDELVRVVCTSWPLRHSDTRWESRPGSLAATRCVGDDGTRVGHEMFVRRGDMINVKPVNGPILSWLELRRIRAKAWLYAKVTEWLVKINTRYIPEESPDHRHYYWYVKDNSVERVAKREEPAVQRTQQGMVILAAQTWGRQHGAFRCDNWRPIVDDADLKDFHRDLLRLGYWTSAR